MLRHYSVDLHMFTALTSRKPHPIAQLGLPLAILTTALVITIAWGAAPPSGSSITLVSDSEPGQRLTIHGRVTGEGGKPVASARLHIYQTDASGHYTPDKPMDEPHARLAGWLRTGKDGRFELHTIRPGGYPKAVRLGDRERKIPAHIHMDVTADGYGPRKVQVVFSDDPLLSDPYWQEWVRKQGHPVVTVSQSTAGQVALLELGLRRSPGM
jgi:protocatechuate 3,4-dioxygenase beta subunit